MEGLRPWWLRPSAIAPSGEEIRGIVDGFPAACGCDLAEAIWCRTLGLDEGVTVRARGILAREVTPGGGDCLDYPCYELAIDAMCRPAL